jgi:hypothetical protein
MEEMKNQEQDENESIADEVQTAVKLVLINISSHAYPFRFS